MPQTADEFLSDAKPSADEFLDGEDIQSKIAQDLSRPPRNGLELAARNFNAASALVGGGVPPPQGQGVGSAVDMLTRPIIPLKWAVDFGKKIDPISIGLRYVQRKAKELTDQSGSPAIKSAGEVIAGANQSVDHLTDFFTSPLGIATLGIGELPAAAQRIVAGAFAAQMASQVPEQASELGKAVGEGDMKKAGQIGTDLAANAVFTLLGAHGALKPGEGPTIDATRWDQFIKTRQYKELINEIAARGGDKNAIQERSTTPVPVGEAPGSSAEVGARVPAPEAPATTQQGTPNIPSKAPASVTPAQAAKPAFLTDAQWKMQSDTRPEDDLTDQEYRDKAMGAALIKRHATTNKLADWLREHGVEVDSFISDPNNHITHVSLDKDGNIEVRIEKHSKDFVTPKLISLRSGDSLGAKVAPTPPAPTVESEPGLTPEQVISSAKQIRVSAPEGATQIRITTKDGKSTVQPLSAVNKGSNPFVGVDIAKIEAGTKDKAGKFSPLKGEISVVDKSPKPALAGPGSPSTGQGPDPKAQIEQLEESFRNVEGKKVPFGQKVKDAFSVGEGLSKAKDALGKGLDGLNSSWTFLKRQWAGYHTMDELLTAKGELSAELEKRGWRLREFEKTVKRQMPDPRERAAMAKWVDAGGDPAELQRGLTEAPDEYKQAYQDALNFTAEQETPAQNIRNFFEARLNEAIDAGVLQDGVEDYIHRIYEHRPGERDRALAYVQSGILNQNPSLAKKRVFQFDWEAEKLGFKPVQDFLPRITTYEASLSKAIAARQFVRKVMGYTDENGNVVPPMRAPDGRPVLAVGGLGIPVEDQSGVRTATLINPHFVPEGKTAYGNRRDYQARDYPALKKWKWVSNFKPQDGPPIYVQGDLLIHPDYVGRIDALLEPSQVRYGRYPRLGRAALGVSGAVKSTMLDFSGFHQVQLAVHGMEHKVLPWAILKNIDFENPDVDGLLKGGVTLGGEFHSSNLSEGVFGSSLSRWIPGIGPLMKTYHDWLFQSYIPRLKMTMALKALERNKARYAPDIASGRMKPEDIYYKTASQANAAFGEQNYIVLERSKTAQDIARVILLAPDFLESRGRFAGQALEKGGKKFGNEQRTALLLGALTMWATARVLNKSISGQWHNEPENLFSVVYNGKSYGLRTIQGDILHLATNPISFWLHRLNPTFTRLPFELITGRDEFGRKRSAAEAAWDTVSNIVPISLRSSRERGIWESLANGFGVTARRWNDVDDAFKLARAWKDKHGVGERGEFIYDPDKDPLRPLKIALSQNDEGSAAKEIKKLLDSKAYTRLKLNEYFDRFATMPFTGSHGNDRKFKATLSDDQKKTVEAATEHRKALRKLYREARAKYDEAEKQPVQQSAEAFLAE